MMTMDWEYWQLVVDIIWLKIQMAYYITKPMHALVIQFAWTVYFIQRYHSTLRQLRKLQAAKEAQDRTLDNLLTTIFRLRKQAKEQQ